jgi:uncharacterized protein (TIGR02246 family)
MKTACLFILINLTATVFLTAQPAAPTERQKKDITALIDQYSKARENRDTVLLKSILTSDIDQLVSSGEWRDGIDAAVQGMLASSATSPGTRTLTIKNIRLFHPETAIVDCQYKIQNADGTVRGMWSTFLVVSEKKTWKISAIRNMLPAP